MKCKCPKCGVEGVPFELKDTDASSAKDPLESVHYVRQLMNQCKVTGTTTARLSRLHNMGNWKWVYRPKDPVKIQALIDEFGQDWAAHPTLDVYRFEFTQDEIDANWGQMQQRRDLLLELQRTGKLLPKVVALMSGMAWECNPEYCPYTEQCECGS